MHRKFSPLFFFSLFPRRIQFVPSINMSTTTTSSTPKGSLFFDLNGTVCSLTTYRYANNNTITTRPNITRMQDLAQKFELIAFTSASEPNALWMSHQVEQDGNFKFDRILHREDCDLVQDSKSGFATTKDLSKHSKNLPRTLIIDDSPDKALDSQLQHWVQIPPYLEGEDDAILHTLVDQLLLIADEPDFTVHTDKIKTALFAARKQQEEAKTAQDQQP